MFSLRTRLPALPLALVLVLALAGCGGGDDARVAGTPQAEAPPTTAPSPGDAVSPADAGDRVLVQGFRFQPAELTVAAGTTVTWSNEDDIRHTATSGTPEAADGRFAVALDGKGTQGSVPFGEAGTYTYFCEVHNSMLGTVVVTG